MNNPDDLNIHDTERQNLQALEIKWLKLTYNSIGDCLFLLSVEPNEIYRFISVNEAFLKVTGMSSEQIIGKRIEETVPPELISKVLSKYREALSEDKTVSWEQETVFPAGRRFGEISIRPLHDGDPQKRYLVGAVHDITDRKRAEEALVYSETELRALFAAMSDVIFVIDETGRHLKVAPTNPEILYRPPHTIVGQTLHDLFDKQTADKFLSHIQTALATRSRVNIEYSLDIKGQEMWFSATVAPMTKDTVIWVARDITDIRHAERSLQERESLYRDTVENANDIIYTLNLNGRYTSVNRAGEFVTGYTREEICNMSFTDVIAPEYLDTVLNNMSQKAKSGGETTYEVEIIAKDQRRVAVEINSRLIEKDGRPIAVLGIARDITDRRRSAEKLNNIEEQLRQSQKLESIGLLAGGVAHDFNNMLTAINGYSELMMRKLSDDDPLRHMVEEIRKAGKRASALTYQMLAFSRKQILQPKTLNINEIVSDVSKMLQRLIGEDIDLRVILNENLGLVKIDPGQTTQVLMNLAVNARDAMVTGGKLTIETDNVVLDENYANQHIAVAPGRYIMLAVSDNGTGIDPETKDRIFEPFFTTKAVGKGTGMGLATVYGIIKQSGGNIWVYSEIGIGTTFKIYLPRIDKEAEHIKEEVINTELPSGTEKILLAEDEALVRDLTREILETCGYTVIEASNGVEAVSVFEKNHDSIDLLITDVIMPEMGGRELVERLKKSHPSIRVLYVSGYTDNAIVHQGILNEDTNFIQKPFTPEDLAKKVREVLDAP